MAEATVDEPRQVSLVHKTASVACGAWHTVVLLKAAALTAADDGADSPGGAVMPRTNDGGEYVDDGDDDDDDDDGGATQRLFGRGAVPGSTRFSSSPSLHAPNGFGGDDGGSGAQQVPPHIPCASAHVWSASLRVYACACWHVYALPPCVPATLFASR